MTTKIVPLSIDYHSSRNMSIQINFRDVALYSISAAISGIVATDRIVVSATPLEAVS